MTVKTPAPSLTYRFVGGDLSLVDHYHLAIQNHDAMRGQQDKIKKLGEKVQKADIIQLYELAQSTHHEMTTLVDRALKLQAGDYSSLSDLTQKQVEHVLLQMGPFVGMTSMIAARLEQKHAYLKQEPA